MDVFTEHLFGGNPLAVVFDAEGLSKSQMQSVATEFNYSETTFILPPREPGHTAHVRIFTSRMEVPFAGHPNVGTAVALARHLESQGKTVGDKFIFEEAAGLVPLTLTRKGGSVVGAELTAPEPLSVRSAVSAADAGECLSLKPTDINTAGHPPQVVSVGLAFLVVELKSREALRQAKPNVIVHERVLPPVGVDGIFVYSRGTAEAATAGGAAVVLHARMFAPLDATVEDPATGSASAATIAFLTQLRPERDVVADWRVEQGVDMGRPSLILGHTEKKAGTVTTVRVGGSAVQVMEGSLTVPG